MIPEFIKHFKDDLKRFEREVIRIEAIPTNRKPLKDEIGVFQSKFLGRPYFPAGRAFPMDEHNRPMLLAAQINFKELPENDILPDDGIMQLFLSGTGWYDDGYEIIYHHEKELTADFIKDFSFISDDDYLEYPIHQVHELLFKKDVDKGGPEDCQFDFVFGENTYWDYYETLTEKQQKELEGYFNSYGHKMGGYASFTQSDPRDYDKDKRSDVQLLQIDMDDNIMFGDAGIAHVFINPDDLMARRFENAYFYWDCC